MERLCADSLPQPDRLTRQHRVATFASTFDRSFVMPHSDPDPSALSRTTTGFIGRERELSELTGAFDRAVEGEGSLAMVVGEPGIGKTSLCEQLAVHVAS